WVRGVLGAREADVVRLQQHLTDVRGQFDYMLNSVSWRLTAPLRAVRGSVRLLSHQRHEPTPGEPPSLDFTIDLDRPAEPIQVKRDQPLRVSGWVRSDAGPVTAILVKVSGADTFFFECPLGEPPSQGQPQRFEVSLQFGVPGDMFAVLGVRRRNGEEADELALPPITVQDDLYCEAMKAHLPTRRAFSVLYLDGLGPDFQSPRYRIDNMREALARVGIGSESTHAVRLCDDLSALRRHDVLVLFRAGWDWRLEAIVKRARQWAIPVVFDVDDYVFEPKIATVEYVDGIRNWPAHKLTEYRYGVEVYRRTLQASEYFTG